MDGTEHYIHTEFGTPLHLACAKGDSAAVRKLLQYSADATILDGKFRTPLTIALEEKRQRRLVLDCSHTEAPLEVILELAKPLYVLNQNLMKAAGFFSKDGEKTLSMLLESDKDLIVSEATICQVLSGSRVRKPIIQLLMERNSGIGVTAKILAAAQTDYNLTELLKYGPVHQITPEILISQKNLRCMEVLVQHDPETPVTKEVILRALELGSPSSGRDSSHNHEGREVLETLLNRCPGITISEDMLHAVRCPKDMEILPTRLDPGTRISNDVVAAVSKLKARDAYLTMLPLLEFDPSIKLDHDVALRMTEHPFAIDALETFMERDPSLPLTEEIFLRIFVRSSRFDEDNRMRLAALMQKFKKRVVLTDEVREVIEHVYRSTSEVEKKEKFYSLMAKEGDKI